MGEKEFADSPYPLFQQRREGEISPVFRSHGHSEIVSFEGRVVTVVNGPGEGIAQATIDIEALRERRAQVKLNILAQLRSSLYAETYEGIDAFPLDHWRNKAVQNRREGAEATKAVIARFSNDKVYVSPESDSAA